MFTTTEKSMRSLKNMTAVTALICFLFTAFKLITVSATAPTSALVLVMYLVGAAVSGTIFFIALISARGERSRIGIAGDVLYRMF